MVRDLWNFASSNNENVFKHKLIISIQEKFPS